MKLRVFAIPFVLVLLAADTKDDAAKAEFKKLEGTWKVVSMEMVGKVMPADETKDMWIFFRAGKLIMKQGKKESSEKLTLDPTTNPKSMEFTGVETTLTFKGEKKTVQTVNQAIYQLDNGKLKICVAFGSSKKKAVKPRDFKTQVGQETVLLVLEREKK